MRAEKVVDELRLGRHDQVPCLPVRTFFQKSDIVIFIIGAFRHADPPITIPGFLAKPHHGDQGWLGPDALVM
jgi:hypothetical protein